MSEITFDKIRYKNRKISLSRPLQVIIEQDDQIFIVKCLEIETHSYADTLDLALESFQEDFLVLWDHIGKEPDENLTKKAVKIKNIFNELVVEDNISEIDFD